MFEVFLSGGILGQDEMYGGLFRALESRLLYLVTNREG